MLIKLILEKVEASDYHWYKITTSRGLTGYVANLKNSNWMTLYYPEEDINPDKEIDSSNEDNIIFECNKEGYYYIYLYKDEKLVIK